MKRQSHRNAGGHCPLVHCTGTVTVTQATVYQISCGGAAASPYTADQYGSGGTARTVTHTITTTGVTNRALQAAYQAERYGAVTYTLPSLTAGASYAVRLHFAELYWTATGKRKFNVAMYGTTVLSSFVIYSATGAQYKAIVKDGTPHFDVSWSDALVDGIANPRVQSDGCAIIPDGPGLGIKPNDANMKAHLTGSHFASLT